MMCGMIQEVVAQQQRQTKQKCLAQSDRRTERSTERMASVSNGGDNMTTNCSFDGVDNLMRYFELAIYIPIFPFGLVLNVVALFVFCIFLRKWTESTIYMTSLALMDLLLLFPLPFKMHATNNFWPTYLQPLCSVLESLYFFGIYGSIYTIMCIAVDRWLAICHPFKAKVLRSPKAALWTCFGVWVLVLAVITQTIYRFREAKEMKFNCFHRFSKNGWKPEVIICLQVFGFLLPALVVVYCSVQTIWALQQSGQHSPQSRACVKIIYSSLSAFLVPFTPSHLGILLQFLVHQEVIQDCSNKKGISLFIQIAMCLSNITCCLDALCYYFIAHEVRSTRNTFRLSIISQRRPTFSTEV
ncbi:G-protein coupled receptor 55 [Micropterus salmoides]|uniref:G-protein coupled receptor 55 n=1 Tax=Micropterus salmoides TaxID=27706 RepID=UPI0018ED9E77|nr:G-protein coupled receptor 55 [Micropterus salmoides]